MKNIALIGFRGTGKTTAGRILAKKLNMLFMDTDSIIEDICGMPVWQIVESYGWTYFRHMEAVVCELLSRKSNLVISTGGGMVVNPENARNLAKNSIMIWLKASPVTIKKRLKKDIMSGKILPSITNSDPLYEVDSVLMEREPYYQKASHFTINTDNMSPEEVADSIITIYQGIDRRAIYGG